jgi:hypothetical protein
MEPTSNGYKKDYGIRASKLPKFTLERAVIPKQSDGLKTGMHKNYQGESRQADSPFESKIIFGNHKNSGI